MSSRKQKLADKRAAAAAHKAARAVERAEAEAKRDIDAEIRDNKEQQEVALKAISKYKYDIDMTDHMGYKGCDLLHGHYVGDDSVLINERLQVKRNKYYRLRTIGENLLNVKYPDLQARRVAEKIANEEHIRSMKLFWGMAFGDKKVVRAAEKPVKVSDHIEVVKRMSVGLIISDESPIRCYHTKGTTYLPCDCIRTGPRDLELSQRALALQATCHLRIFDSVSSAQNMHIELINEDDDQKKATLNVYGGIARAIAECTLHDD